MAIRQLVLFHRLAVGACVAALVVLGPPLVVTAQSFSPARLVELPLENIACPTSEQASPVIICQAVVTRSGLVFNGDGTHCFGDIEADRERASLITRRVRLAEFEPATVDGRRTKVFASFRLLFREENGVCNATYLPNLGTQQDVLGFDYTDPQEIVTLGSWTNRARPTWRSDGSAGVAFAMSVAVDELGNASDGRVESNNFAPDDTVRASVRALEESQFIPAFVGAAPRSSRYFEFYYIHPGCDTADPPAKARRDRC